MKLWISIAAGIPLGAAAFHHFRSLPWFEHVIHFCPDFKYSIHTGVSALDIPLCIVVNVFAHAMHNSLGYNVTWVLLGLFGTLLCMMAVEGSRRKSNWLLACFPLWGMACNSIGISVVQPLLWLPTFYYSFDNIAPNDVDAYYIRNARSNGILVTLLAAYVIPTAFLLLGVVADTLLERTVIAVWQFLPLVMGPMMNLASSSLACLDDPDDPRMTEIARKKLRVADSRNAVERLYMIIGIFNALIYYAVYIRLKVDNMLSWETVVDLATLYSGKLTALSIEQLGEMVTTHAFFLDIVVCYITCIFWALLESGIKGVGILLVASIVIGPGAGVCLYAVYREGHIQDIEKVVKKDQ